MKCVTIVTDSSLVITSCVYYKYVKEYLMKIKCICYKKIARNEKKYRKNFKKGKKRIQKKEMK
jgi:hypothetical protein